MFISFEGGEGSGKTSQIKKVCAFFHSIGVKYLVTREPGNGLIGKQIRSILLRPENEILVPRAELLLFMADRAQHIETVITPAIESGKVVLCDRFFDSTLVYQGIVGRVGFEKTLQFHNLVFNGLRPDVTFLLDLSPEIGLARTWRQLDEGDRGQDESRFERKKLDFHEQVRQGFLKLAGLEPKRFRIIDAEKSCRDVWSDIKFVLKKEF